MTRIRKVSIVVFVMLTGVVLAVVAVSAVPELKWRAQIVGMKAQGDLDDLTWTELFRMLRPDGPYYLEPLVRGGTPYSVIRNPYTDTADVEAGAELYRRNCTLCHKDGEIDATGVDLGSEHYKNGDSDWAVYRVLTRGVPGAAMPSFDLPARDAWQIISFLRSRQESRRSIESDSFRSHDPVTEVTPEMLAGAEDEPSNWVTYSGSYRANRYSRLDQVQPRNVGSLRPEWIHQMATDSTVVEATPIVVGDYMFVSEPPNSVVALDAATGELRWKYSRPLPENLKLCCNMVNRGVAVHGRHVLWSTLDAHLVALDAATGAPIWETEIADHSAGYSSTAAPLVIGDRVIVGVAGGEFAIRGFVDAYDALTGARLWRFYTIPGPGEPGNQTWSGDSWQTGGGATWMTGSYDAELNLIYWGVGNPWPDFNGDSRRGDNLYTDSVVALDADTGRLRWHVQFVPHDLWDYDANSVPILADLEVAGTLRKVLLMAVKNGFLYVIDRETGQFLSATALTRQTWAKTIDATGRPVVNEVALPSEKGSVVYPGAGGGPAWWPPSFNPSTSLLYVPMLDHGQTFFEGPLRLSESQQPTLGSTSLDIKAEPARTALRAVAPVTGEIVWEAEGTSRSGWSKAGGTLSTAGGLVFWSDLQDFIAFDAATGAELWRFNTGGRINAAPMTFAVEGKQLISIAAGRSILTFALP